MEHRKTADDAFPIVSVLSIWFCWLAIILPRMIVPPLLPLIEEDFRLSQGDAALLMSVYMLSYGLLQLPAGSLSDRFGNRVLIILSVFGACFPTVLMVFTATFGSLLLFRVLSGVAAGLFYAPSTAYIIQLTNQKHVGMALGLTFTGGSVASILISALVNFFPVQQYGWKFFFPLCAIPGLIFTPVLLFLFRENKKEVAATHQRPHISDILHGLRRAEVAFLMIYNFVSSLSGWSLTTFVPTFLVLERGFTVSEAAALMLINYATSFASGPLSGILTQKIGYKKPIIIAAAGLITTSLLFPLSYTPAMIGVALALWGLIGGLSWSPSNIFLSAITPKNLRGTFLGVFNLVGFLSGTVGPILFGTIIDTFGFNAFFISSLILNTVAAGLTAAMIRKSRQTKEL